MSEEGKPPDGEGSRYIIEQLRERMVAADQQRERAVQLQAESYERALERQRENQEQQVQASEQRLSDRIAAGDSELLVRIDGIKEAGDKLASERDRAAEALRIVTAKRIEQADMERAKSADRLAETLGERIGSVSTETHSLEKSLNRRVDEGDAHLRQHIDQQVMQIQQALDAARREFDITHESSERAIQKAEAAADKRFDSINKFREQLDSQAKDFMPRELATAQFDEFRKQITELQRKESSKTGQSMGNERAIGLLIGVSTLLLGITVVLVNILL
jgi:hypothetical protein